MRSLLIIGAGSHGKAVEETARACGYEKIDYLDDNNAKAIGGTSEIEKLAPQYDGVIVSIGNNALREAFLKRIINPVTLVHPRTFVSPSASIGAGTIIMPGAVVHSNAVIGRGCIISIGVLIDHDAEIGDYCHLNTGVIVRAGSKVHSDTKIDVGCVL